MDSRNRWLPDEVRGALIQGRVANRISRPARIVVLCPPLVCSAILGGARSACWCCSCRELGRHLYRFRWCNSGGFVLLSGRKAIRAERAAAFPPCNKNGAAVARGHSSVLIARSPYSAACFLGGSSALESADLRDPDARRSRSTLARISSVCSPSSGERSTGTSLSDSLIGLPTVR